MIARPTSMNLERVKWLDGSWQVWFPGPVIETVFGDGAYLHRPPRFTKFTSAGFLILSEAAVIELLWTLRTMISNHRP